MFKKKDYFNIGKNGAVADVQKAFAKPKDGCVSQEKLYLGAAEAFHEGRPENIQAILADRDNPHWIPKERFVFVVICHLVKGRDDPFNMIMLALEKFSTAQKQEALNGFLYQAFTTRSLQGADAEALVEALLKADTDVSLAGDASAISRTMAQAIHIGHSTRLIKLLHENGAQFDEARDLICSRGYNEADISGDLDRLNALQEEITGEPATEVGRLRKRVEQLEKALAGKFNEPAGTPLSTADNMAPPAAQKPAAPRRMLRLFP